MTITTETTLRILFIEDNPHDRIAFRRAMKNCDITECKHASEAEACLASGDFALVVVDEHLPETSGLELCRQLMHKQIHLPLVILTGSGSEALALEALQAGVDDYIIKDPAGGYLHLLPHVLPEIVQRYHRRRASLMAEFACNENRILLAQIVDGSPVATFALDREHRVTHWNRACEILTGIPAAEVLGTHGQWRAFYDSERPVLADLIVDGETAETVSLHYPEKWRKSELIEDAFEVEDFFPRFGAEGRWLYFTAAPLRNGSGQVVGAIETLQDFTGRRRAEAALKESEERYRQLAITDGLTGLYNSRHFYQQLSRECERATRYQHPLALLLIDADHFKVFNDAHGHLAGDKALQALADSIRCCLRTSDSAYRYGGEEFTVLLPETSPDAAASLAERLRADVAAMNLHPASGIVEHISVSIGVAEYASGETPANFVRRADNAAYHAKGAGRNRVVVLHADA